MMKKTEKILSIVAIICSLLVVFSLMPVKSFCIENGVWEILQDEYGWDQDGDGVEVHSAENIDQFLNEYTSAMDKYYGTASSSSTSSSKPSANKSSSTKSVSKCEHDYVAEITTPATCTSEGVTTYTCSKCGDTYTEAIPIDVNAHDWSEPVRVEPTCTEKGTITKTCSLCSKEEVEEIPALGHDYKDAVTKEPTCTELGVKTFTCSRCNDSYTEDIPALGHVESDWIIDKEVTAFFEGNRHKVCTRCNETLITEVIPSRYPTWYLYALIIIGLIIAGMIIMIVCKKKKSEPAIGENV